MSSYSTEKIRQINATMGRTQRRYSKWARAHNVNYYVFDVLYLIRCNGLNKQNEIAEMHGLPKQTVNSVVCELQKSGYIKLETDLTDKRSKLIVLTEKGEEYADEVVGEIIEIEKNVIEKLGSERAEMFVSVLNEYDNLLKEEIKEHSEDKNEHKNI